jgi:hypothetical protein
MICICYKKCDGIENDRRPGVCGNRKLSVEGKMRQDKNYEYLYGWLRMGSKIKKGRDVCCEDLRYGVLDKNGPQSRVKTGKGCHFR